MKYLTFLFLILVASCSTNEEKSETKHYSDDTNRAFEMIERGGSYYLKKAPTNTAPAPQVQVQPPKTKRIVEILKPGEQQAVQEEIVIDEKINYQEKEKEKATSSKADERLIEINQNLAFYCMKHRKDPKFNGNEEKCMKFVNKTMTECQKVHRIVNSRLLNCIQTKLKGRR